MVYESDPRQSAYQGPVGREMPCYLSQAPEDMRAAFKEVEGVAFKRQVHDQQAMLDHLLCQADACTEPQAAFPRLSNVAVAGENQPMLYSRPRSTLRTKTITLSSPDKFPPEIMSPGSKRQRRQARARRGRGLRRSDSRSVPFPQCGQWHQQRTFVFSNR